MNQRRTVEKLDPQVLSELRENFARRVLTMPDGTPKQCWFAAHHPDADPRECRGPLQGAHLYPRRRAERILRERDYPERTVQTAVWSPNCGVPGCELHHSAYDHKGKPLYIARWSMLPEKFYAWAERYQLTADVEDTFRA